MNEQYDKQLRDAHDEFGRDHQRLRADLLVRLGQEQPARLGRPRAIARRLIGDFEMKSALPRFAAAAALIITVGVASVFLLKNSATPAYAIEETLEANELVRFVHVKLANCGAGLEEAWAEFSEDGELARLRMHYPKTPDGPKQVVWQEGKAEIWFQAKNGVAIVIEENALSKLRGFGKMCDPKVAMQVIYKAQATGQATIETVQPTEDGEPIRLIVTYLPADQERREVCLVDGETKLLIEKETFRLEGEEYVSVGRLEYFDYDKPVDDKVFELEVPDGTIRVDRTTTEVGLPKGDLSDEEIATKLARQFIEAMIAGDYTEAGRLVGGVPASWVEKKFGDTKFLRIVSMAAPVAAAKEQHGLGAMRVRCELDVELDGRKPAAKVYEILVRQIYGQPDQRIVVGFGDM